MERMIVLGQFEFELDREGNYIIINNDYRIEKGQTMIINTDKGPLTYTFNDLLNYILFDKLP